MNPAILLSTVTLTLQVAALIVALVIGGAPGWRRVRILAVLAASAGVYSLSSLVTWAIGHSATVTWIGANLNFVVVGVHVAAWLWFSYTDLSGSWRVLPTWVRRTAVTTVAVTALLGISGLAHDVGSYSIVAVPRLGYSFGRVELTPLGMAGAALILGVVLLSLVRQVRALRAGARGAGFIVAGFVVLLLAGVEEALVAAGVIDFMFLAELGYLALVIPVTEQFIARFVDDAHRLEEVTAQLNMDVRTATEELDAARQALEVQQRFAAIGRIAGGIGHEINNPLQVLLLNLEELAERHLRDASTETHEALAEATAAADRIGGVVAAVRAYAQPLAMAAAPIALGDVVETAVRSVRTGSRSQTNLRVAHDRAPTVQGDPERLAQLVAAAIGNAAKVLERRGTFGEIRVRTGSAPAGEAFIEVADNGPGFPPRVLERLDAFVTSTREAAGASGLGLFVARSIVEAHGGRLELGRSDLGGALFRVRLPSASAPRNLSPAPAVTTP
jgi:signal transduction histidine kinase